MSKSTGKPLWISGPIAVDDIVTEADTRQQLLGGAAAYAAFAAQFFSPVQLGSIVGGDFPEAYWKLFLDNGMDVSGVDRQAQLKSFSWSGRYEKDMNRRETVSIDFGILDAFAPDGGPSQAVVLLANMRPCYQLRALAACNDPSFVIADTMDLWIEQDRDALGELLKKVDLLVLNEHEARLLTKKQSLIVSGTELLELGPRFVIIKKGEHGALLFGEASFFQCCAYPLESVVDPTGAGDSFIGTIAGVIAGSEGEITFECLASALQWGTVTASFTCEAFGPERLVSLSRTELETRKSEWEQSFLIR